MYVAAQHCDWPEASDCDFTPEKARKLQLANPTVIYLTFDDGPTEGSEQVLDALRVGDIKGLSISFLSNEMTFSCVQLQAYNVPATFFINSQHLKERLLKEKNQFLSILSS